MGSAEPLARSLAAVDGGDTAPDDHDSLHPVIVPGRCYRRRYLVARSGRRPASQGNARANEERQKIRAIPASGLTGVAQEDPSCRLTQP
jgi:hypothetical protein